MQRCSFVTSPLPWRGGSGWTVSPSSAPALSGLPCSLWLMVGTSNLTPSLVSLSPQDAPSSRPPQWVAASAALGHILTRFRLTRSLLPPSPFPQTLAGPVVVATLTIPHMTHGGRGCLEDPRSCRNRETCGTFSFPAEPVPLPCGLEGGGCWFCCGFRGNGASPGVWTGSRAGSCDARGSLSLQCALGGYCSGPFKHLPQVCNGVPWWALLLGAKVMFQRGTLRPSHAT